MLNNGTITLELIREPLPYNRRAHILCFFFGRGIRSHVLGGIVTCFHHHTNSALPRGNSKIYSWRNARRNILGKPKDVQNFERLY